MKCFVPDLIWRKAQARDCRDSIPGAIDEFIDGEERNERRGSIMGAGRRIADQVSAQWARGTVWETEIDQIGAQGGQVRMRDDIVVDIRGVDLSQYGGRQSR